MFRDLRERPLTSDLETDLCIIGAGAAGITIARQFDGTGVSVCLVESGGMRAEEAVQDLYQGECADAHYKLESTRLRFFGGTTNHWTGACGLQDPIDFEPRPWIGAPGWPITRDSLIPFYKRAHEVLEIGPFEYDPAQIAPGRSFPAFDAAKLAIRVARFSPPTRFNQKYGGQIGESSNVTCLLNANVVDFETTHEASHVSAVRVATLNGDECRVRARVFVLACGGLENPRVLLNASATPNGLGNANGLVGRYFADHIHHRSTAMVVTQGDWWESFKALTYEGFRATPSLCLSDDVQRREGLLNCRAALWPLDPQPGVREGAECLGIYGYGEPIASQDKRVELSDKRDALGLRQIRLHWSIAEAERRTLERCIVLVAEELGRLKLGFVRLDERLDARPGIEKRLWWAAHHMGTTRMTADASQGVVDPDCRMHGVENMYIAGSSVFPAYGQINPTLTIVALALRLGDHLTERLGGGAPGAPASDGSGGGGRP